MISNKKAVIFDLDGTLLNTLDDLTDSVNHIMKLHHFPTHSAQAVRSMVGNGIFVLLELAVPRGRDNPLYRQCTEEFQEYYASHMQIKTAPFEGILSLLSSLKEQGVALAIVSNKFDLAVKGLCKDYFADTISVAIGETSAVARKPAPDTVYEAAHQLQVPISNCIYVGDSDVDIATAKNANIPCICVDWGFRDRSFLKEHGASCIVSTTDELLQALLQRLF